MNDEIQAFIAQHNISTDTHMGVTYYTIFKYGPSVRTYHDCPDRFELLVGHDAADEWDDCEHVHSSHDSLIEALKALVAIGDK